MFFYYYLHKTYLINGDTAVNYLLAGLGTGETLHMSQQEQSPLWIQSPEETSRV